MAQGSSRGPRPSRLATCLAVSVALFPLALPASAATGLLLAREGKPLVQIAVASATAIPAEKTAASELATYLEKITGAAWVTVEETAVPAKSAAIYVGDTQFARAHGIDPDQLGAEESVVRTVNGSLLITGGRPRGTLYGVFDFLENVLGVRWYTPWMEQVPAAATLTIPELDRRTQPYLRFRSHYTDLLMTQSGVPTPPEWKWFNVHNRINEVSTSGPLDDSVGGGVAYGPRIYGGHGFAPYLPSDKYFADHPEYYSMREGKRVPSNGLDGNHACLTNPDVLRIITEGVKEDMRANPTAYCFTVAVNDGNCQTLCDCPVCREMARKYGGSDEPYTDAGLLLWFVNQVADSVKPEFPDKFIRTLAYGPAFKPPVGIEARDNVIVHICAGSRSEAVYLPRGNDSIELKPISGWIPHAKHIWLWDAALPAGYNYPGFFRPLTWKMDQQMKYFKALGAIDGIFQQNDLLASEDSMFAQFYEMDMWIYTRLCQDPDQDVEALVTDFLNGYYGPAGKPLRAYVSLIKSRLPRFPYRFWDYPTMKQAQDLFDQAEAAVNDQPDYLDRVRAARMQLDLCALVWRNTLRASYLAGGGKAEQYPYPVATLQARLLGTLDTSKDPLLNALESRWSIKGRGGRENVKDIIRQYVEEVSAGAEYTPLPEQFRDLPADRVIDLTAPLFGGANFPIVVPDPDAALGLAVPRIEKNEMPMNISYWNVHGGPAGITPDTPLGVTIKPEDVPGPGYHLYQGPTFKLAEWTYMYLTRSWQLQKHLYTLYDPAHPDRKWTAYCSMKFSGPDYPHGQADEPKGLFLDRLILVRENE